MRQRDERRIPCPMCNSLDYNFIYVDAFNTPLGCSECVRAIDESIWQEEVEEQLYDEYVDARVDEALGK